MQMRPNPPKHQLSSYAGPLEEAEYERRASLDPQWLTTNATLTVLASAVPSEVGLSAS